MSNPWLTIIGIGDSGLESLTTEANVLLGEAETVIAPQRILDTTDLPGKKLEPWAGKLQEAVDRLVERRGEKIAILATGDPMHFGIGATLTKRIPLDEMRIIPSPSAFSLATARLGWPRQDCACISLHGRPVEKLQSSLAPNARIIALTSGSNSIQDIVNILCDSGFGTAKVSVLEHMGGATEHRLDFIANDYNGAEIAEFNTIAIECADAGETAQFGSVPGLPDHAYVHDGQLTKREVRAVALSLLRPYSGALLWDIGAGCGSIGIEWMRGSVGAKAIAIEQHKTRLGFTERNAVSLGVPELRIVEGRAPAALAGLPAPDAIFCGGGITHEGVFETAWEALKDRGVFVANTVTLESEAKLLSFHEQFGGELIRLSVSRAKPVGRLHGWKPFMPVTIWSVRK